MTTDMIPTTDGNRSRLPILDDPEMQQALQHIRSALETLHGELVPLYERARSLPEAAQAMEITDNDSYDFAQEWCRQEVLDVEARIKRVLDPYCQAGNVVHKAFTGLRSQALDYPTRARRAIDASSIAYQEEQDRRRREAERRAAEERDRLERKARAERSGPIFFAVVTYVAEALEKKRELEEAAAAAKESGDTEIAEAMTEEIKSGAFAPTPEPQPELELPVMTPPVELPEAPTAKGASRRKNLKGRLKQGHTLIDLVRFVAQHPEHVGTLALDEKGVNAAAKAYGDKLRELIPVLEAYDNPSMSRKRK